MTDGHSRSDEPKGRPGPAQVTMRDVLIIFVGIGAFCGLLAQLIGVAAPNQSLACILLVLWITVGVWLWYDGARRHSCLLRALGGLSLSVLLCGWCVLPAISPASRSIARRTQCTNNLRHIAIALHQYHETYGCFPPAYVADEQGRPMHSWRVLLLPFLDEAQLYKQYDFREPWDGPNNSRLSARMPECYLCPSSPSGPGTPPLTVYVAVVGPGTVWPGATPTKKTAVVDRPDSTILVVESSAAPVSWMAPQDLAVQSLPLEINSKVGKGISNGHRHGAYAAFVDGSVAFLSDKTCSPPQLQAMLTVAGGEPIEPPGNE